MKKIMSLIILVMVLVVVLSNNVFAGVADSKIATITKFECIKHSNGRAIEIWLGDIPNNKLYIKKNGNFEKNWLDENKEVLYKDDVISLTMKVLTRNNKYKFSKTFNLVEGTNEFDYEFMCNKFKISIEVPVPLTSTPTQTIEPTTSQTIEPTATATQTIEPTATATTTQTFTAEPTETSTTAEATNTPTETPTATQSSTTNTISPTEDINETETPVSTNNDKQELPKTGEGANNIYMLLGIPIIGIGLAMLKRRFV